MTKKLGRPRKAPLAASPSVLVPVELLRSALRDVAATPVEEMTLERFIASSAKELDAAFADERPKAELLRKLLAILGKADGWHGQEADISALLDVAFAARHAGDSASGAPPNAAPTAASENPSAVPNAPLSPSGAQENRGAHATARAASSDQPATPTSAQQRGYARQFKDGAPEHQNATGWALTSGVSDDGGPGLPKPREGLLDPHRTQQTPPDPTRWPQQIPGEQFGYDRRAHPGRQGEGTDR